MSKIESVRFGPETWGKGHRGLLRAHATDKPDISDFWMYDNGILGPRSTWVVLDTLASSYPLASRIWPCLFGNPYDLVGGIAGFAVAHAGGCDFYEYGNTTAYATSTTAMTEVDKDTTVTPIDDFTWLVGRYRVLLSDPTPTYNVTVTDLGTALIAAFFAGNTWRCLGSTIHQGRAFYWGPNQVAVGTTYFNRQRVYYSDAYLYGTFSSASQYFDVDGVVQGCVSVGANLMIWTSAGDWYILQGRGDPALGTLSYIGKGRIPGYKRYPVVRDRSALFTSSDSQALVLITQGGEINDTELRYLGFDTVAADKSETPPPSPVASSIYDSVIVPYFTHTHRLHNGVWVKEDHGVSVGLSFQYGADDYKAWDLVAEYGTAVANRWRVYRRATTTDGPTSIGILTPGETVSSDIVLPRLFHPTKQVRVRRVIIDGVTWEAGSDPTPATVLTVQVRDGKANTTNLVLGPGDNPLSSTIVPDVANNPIRLVATGAPVGYTSFCDVVLSGVKKLGIEAVTVEFEISEGPIQ